MRVSATIFAFCACACVLAQKAIAQVHQQGAQGPNRRELVGLVRDGRGAGVEGATVEIKGASAGTNDKGAFQLWTAEIDTVTIAIRRLGYSPISALISTRNGQWDTLVVEMDQTSQQLAAVTVTGSAGRRANGLRTFDARRAIGNGTYVTHDEIVQHNTMRTSDVLRGKRGINLIKLSNGTFGVRFALYSHSKTKCTPDLWIDGTWSRDTEIDEILPSDIEAMELYETMASVPFEFTSHSKTTPCGTIVIWTRVPSK
jgi:hypothetical protein